MNMQDKKDDINKVSLEEYLNALSRYRYNHSD